jgi:hypothetical protein
MMCRLRNVVTPLALVGATVAWIGCSTEPAPQKAAEVAPGDAPAAAPDETTAAESGELAELPEADRELAAAQRICPVSGEPLGSMGTPIKITVGDRSLFVCCSGCEEEARKNFDQLYVKATSPAEAATQ